MKPAEVLLKSLQINAFVKKRKKQFFFLSNSHFNYVVFKYPSGNEICILNLSSVKSHILMVDRLFPKLCGAKD